MRTSSFPWYLQHFGARTVHVEWSFATRIHLGFWFRVGLFRVGFQVGLVVFSVSFRFFGVGFGVALVWFRVSLGFV